MKMASYEPIEKKKLSNVQLTVLIGVLILAASILFILSLWFLSVHGRNSSLNLDRVSEDMQAMKYFICDYKDDVKEHIRSLADRKCKSELLNGNGKKAGSADNEVVNGVVIKKSENEEEEHSSLRILRKEDEEMIEDKKHHYFCKYSKNVLARIFETMNSVCSGDALKLSRFARSYNAE